MAEAVAGQCGKKPTLNPFFNGESMNIFQSLLLGIVQGLTEFIPVSSTAHLLIGQKILGIPANDAMFSFLVLVQLGTIVSIIFYFWNDLWKILLATVSSIKYLVACEPGKVDTEARLGWYIIIATIPALIFGYLLKSAVEALFKEPLLEAGIRLLITAVVLGLAEWLGKRNRTLGRMTWLDALFVGIAQVLAVFPGASRSGTTISAGMARGLDRRSAARFAFLMSVPVMLAAGGYESLKLLKMSGLGSFLPLIAVGFITAAVVGWFAVKWLLDYLNKHSLYIFAGYCAVAGLIVLIIQFAF
jgi:undecaprenyl-diphosphatase